MLIGYARTSTDDQKAGLEAQVKELKALGCERLYVEETSACGPRPKLEDAIDYMRDSDTLVVTKLDRLARSVRHMWEIIERLEKKGIGLRIINMGVDTKSPTGKLVLTMLGGIAEFEREMMLERQREGIRKAKTDGKYKGRVPTARRQSDAILALHRAGKTPGDIVKELKVSRASVYRILAENEAAWASPCGDTAGELADVFGLGWAFRTRRISA